MSGLEYRMEVDEAVRSLEYEVNRCSKKDYKCTVALQWMPPQEFMKMLVCPCGEERCDEAPEEWFNGESIHDLTDKMKHGQRLDPLRIDLTDRMIYMCQLTDRYLNHYDHDGRHRAFTARKLGIPLVPVVVIADRKTAQKCLIPEWIE